MRYRDTPFFYCHKICRAVHVKHLIVGRRTEVQELSEMKHLLSVHVSVGGVSCVRIKISGSDIGLNCGL